MFGRSKTRITEIDKKEILEGQTRSLLNMLPSGQDENSDLFQCKEDFRGQCSADFIIHPTQKLTGLMKAVNHSKSQKLVTLVGELMDEGDSPLR